MHTLAVCLIKPDGMDCETEIISYLVSCGVTILGTTSRYLTHADVVCLYPTLLTRPDALALTSQNMTSEPVRILLCSSDERIYERLGNAKRYLRTTYRKENPKGVVHTSEDEIEAKREIEYFFEAHWIL